MSPSSRKTFLRHVIPATIGIAFLPKKLLSSTFGGPTKSPPPTASPFEPNRYAIIDLHCHPSLKMDLWNRHFWRRHVAGSGVNALDMQDDLRHLTSGTIPQQPGIGFVKGVVVAHYLVEAAAEREWNLLRKIYPWIARLFRHFADKIEHEDWTNFNQIRDIMCEWEGQIEAANRKQSDVVFTLPKSFAEFSRDIAEGRFPVAHGIEGAHALGRNQPISTNRKGRQPVRGQMQTSGPDGASRYTRNLECLKDKGVCMITLAHLFPNDIAGCVEGISPDEKKSIGMTATYINADQPPIPSPLHFYNTPLSPVGVAVVNKMLEWGIVIDLTHSTPKIREQVFNLNKEYAKASGRPRPLVFTHTGAREIFLRHDIARRKLQFPDFSWYCVSQQEIAEIVACGGTIGVIPEVFWLAGADTHLRKYGFKPEFYRNGIPFMLETIRYLHQVIGNYDHITIGTDFDGYADAPRDLYEAPQLGTLIEAMLEAGIGPEDVARITSGNALRVLRLGWGHT
jgi:microsomal dipeptidase-like Zn-dependent dipeptidase